MLRRSLLPLLAPFWLVLAGASCEASYPTIPDSQQALFGQMLSLLDCAAAADSGTVMLAATTIDGVAVPAYTGEVDARAAISCLRDLQARDHVNPVDSHRLANDCRDGAAAGCILHDFNGCGNDRILFPADAVPTTLTSVGPNFGTFSQSAIDLGGILYHEATHSLQTSRFGECGSSREPEAYTREIRFYSFFHSQITSSGLVPLSTFDPCSSIDAAVANGLSTCVRDFMVGGFPGVDTAAPLPVAACNDLRALRMRGSSQTVDRLTSVARQRVTSVGCVSSTLVTSDLRASSEDYPYFTAVIRGDSTIYQYQVDAGAVTLVNSFPTDMSVIRDLTIVRDAAGVETLLVAGTRLGTGTLRVQRDFNTGEFYTPPDGLFDGASWHVADPRLREIARIVDAGLSPLMAWDDRTQRAIRISMDAEGLPASFASATAVRIPIDREADDFWHDPTRTIGMALLTDAYSTELPALQFEEFGSGVYALTDEGTATEMGLVPPSFLSAPRNNQAGVWASGPVGSVVQAFPVQADGTSTGGATLGSAVIGPSGRLWIPFYRAVTSGERVRLKDATSGVQGPYLSVQAWRPEANFIWPENGASSGGTVVTIRGAGLAGTTSIKFDSIPGTSLTVVDDRTVRVTTPASASPDAAITATIGGVTYVLGNFSFDSVYRSGWAETALSSWSGAGSGWTCGATAIDLADVPGTGSRAGCQYSGSTGTGGVRVSPSIALPTQSGPFLVNIHHRGSFGMDGDGLAVLATNGTSTWELLPRDGASRRVHAAACTGPAGSRTCSPDPEGAGRRGLSRDAVGSGWRTTVFELPAAFDAGGPLVLRLAATNMSAVAAAEAQISSVDVRRIEDRRARIRSTWTTIAAADSACAGWSTTGSFFCTTTSPVPGAVGSVLRYSNAPLSTSVGEARYTVNFTGLADRTISASIRHAVDMTAGAAVGSGHARLRVCCGSTCTLALPVNGYPVPPPGVVDAFTDEGPDAVGWMTDEFDLSAWGGSGTCQLMFKGQGQVAASQPGWVVDSLLVRWR